MADQVTASLKSESIDSIDWTLVKRQQVANWARNKHKPPFRINERLWVPMKEGKPVPGQMIEALSAYLITVLGKDKDEFSVDAISSPGGSVERREPVVDAWRLDWLKLFSLKVKPFTIPEAAYCQNESDIMDAALMVMQGFGHRETKSSNRQACIDYAARVMRRTPAECARLFLDAWKANENAVLFTVRERTDGSVERIGSSVVIPLTKDFYERFRAGEVEDIDATRSDMLGESLHVLIEAVNENPEIDIRQEKGRRSMLQVETVLYQLATACPPLNSWSANPSFITIGGDDESIRRLKSYHYEEVGTRTRLTGKPVMEFAPPEESMLTGMPLIAFAQYLSMKPLLLIYQFIKSKKLLIED